MCDSAGTVRDAQQRRYAGGQICPGCDDVVGAADRYCRWCGEQLREQ